MFFQQRQAKRKRYRIFIGFHEAAGYYSRISQGFRSLGHEVTFVTLQPHRFGYEGVSESHPLTLGIRAAHTKYIQPRWVLDCTKLIKRFKPSSCFKGVSKLPFFGALFRPAESKLIKFEAKVHSKINHRLVKLHRVLFSQSLYLKRWRFLLQAAFTHDVFLFTGPWSFFKSNIDLPVLRLLNKTVINMFTGSDARPAYMGIIQKEDHKKQADFVAQQWARIRRVERWANYCTNHPPMGIFHTKPFISCMYLGFPYESPSYAPLIDPASINRSSAIRILHAPSNPQVKGTAIIRAAIEKFRIEGFEIDYIELIERPHSEVLEALQSCDFVIDELYSDAPLAGFGTEAAYYGKPVIVCGYYATEITKDYPSNILPPSRFTEPEQLEASILYYLCNPLEREADGKRLQEFVRTQWAPKAVCERLIQMVEGKPAAEWFHDPYKTKYFYGFGKTKTNFKISAKKYIQANGIGALHLDDKPELLDRLLQAVMDSLL